MVLETVTVSPYETNCYVLGASHESVGLIIDPGDEAEKILSGIKQLGLSIELIVLTHGHIDHLGALSEIKAATGARVAIHKADAGMLKDRALAALLGMKSAKNPDPDILLIDGQKIKVSDLELTVIHTPGHTRGSISLLGDCMVFTGDTLFREGIGRTDLPGGSYAEIIESIKRKLLTLPPTYLIYPGHGPPSNIGYERASNPFLG